MSENIFKEIYDKVLSLFKQTEKEDNAKDIAKNRLRVVLMQDRTNLTPELLQRMRKELVELLSKYVEMDKEALELNLEQEGDQMALMLSIPVIRAKDEAEIEKALAEGKNEAEEETEETDDDGDSEDSSDSEEDNTDGSEPEEETSDAEDDSSEDKAEQEEETSEEESSDGETPEEEPEKVDKKQKSDISEDSEEDK